MGAVLSTVPAAFTVKHSWFRYTSTKISPRSFRIWIWTPLVWHSMALDVAKIHQQRWSVCNEWPTIGIWDCDGCRNFCTGREPMMYCISTKNLQTVPIILQHVFFFYCVRVNKSRTVVGQTTHNGPTFINTPTQEQEFHIFSITFFSTIQWKGYWALGRHCPPLGLKYSKGEDKPNAHNEKTKTK